MDRGRIPDIKLSIPTDTTSKTVDANLKDYIVKNALVNLSGPDSIIGKAVLI